MFNSTSHLFLNDVLKNNGIQLKRADENHFIMTDIFKLTRRQVFLYKFDILLIHENGEEELIYTALDYLHPPILSINPPLVVTAGQSLMARATYYNNTDNVVTFGLLSIDEMMIIFGLAYFE